MMAKEALGRLPDGAGQVRRVKHHRVAAPAQNPSLDFHQTGKLQMELDSAVVQFAQP